MKINYKYLTNLILFLVVSFIVIFYLFAKGVNIVILPVEASYDAKIKLVKGFGVSLTERFIFFPGEKTVLAKAPGFHDQEMTFIVDGSSDTHTLKLKKLPGKVSIITVPVITGQILIDNKPTNQINDYYEIEAGIHSLDFTHPMFLPYSSSIDVVGMGKEQKIVINLEPNWATISINSDPSNAQVYSSDEYLGETPLIVDLVSGLQELVFVKEGYQNKISLVRVVKDQDKTLDPIKLQLLPSIVQVSSNPKSAKVFLDNVFKGLSPIEISLSPNQDKVISLELDGYYSSSKNFNLRSKQKVVYDPNLIPVLGRVKIDANLTSKIYLNDKFLGNTPLSANIHAVEVNLAIRKEGYRSFETPLKSNEEFETNVNAVLVKEEIARFNESQKTYKTKNDNQMVLLNPDFIKMGAKRSQIGQRANETIREVRLTKPFYLSVHEVTNAQYSNFKKRDNDNQSIEANNLPVVNISWNDAALYCNWLSKIEGLKPFYKIQDGKAVSFHLDSEGYRMPTEAEWEWTAKNNPAKEKDLIFPWGYEMPVRKGSGNYADESSKQFTTSYIPDYQDKYPKRAPVGSFEPNRKGVYDLGGNVSEFVNDFYAIMIENNAIYIDLTGPDRGKGHVVKGSNWNSASLTELRYSYRDESLKGDDKTGFRIARWLLGKGKNYD